MSDIELVVRTLQESGPGAAATVGGLWAARRMLGPTLDAVGERWADLTRQRMDNLASISRKTEALNANPGPFPHVRVTQKVLNDATLYDDNVMQTYVAGLLAGSRNDDGSDDRPIYYLTVIDGLTADQMRMFHVLYAALAQVGRTKVGDGDVGGVHLSLTADDISEAMDELGTTRDFGPEMALALEHAGLIAGLSARTHSDDTYRIQYVGTRIGSLLFDWAHGIDDEDLTRFFSRERPSIGIPDLQFSSAQIV